MDMPDLLELPAAQHLAVAHTPPCARPALLALLAFDARLGTLVAGASEPLLGQMRLAWWREQLARPPAQRAMGDPVLAAIGAQWHGAEPHLIALIDGWEELFAPGPLTTDAIARHAKARADPFVELARRLGYDDRADEAGAAGTRWALADLAFRLRDPVERERCLTLHAASQAGPRLPRALRGLALLDGLAARAMARQQPLMSGRGAALAAMRLGLFGR